MSGEYKENLQHTTLEEGRTTEISLLRIQLGLSAGSCHSVACAASSEKMQSLLLASIQSLPLACHSLHNSHSFSYFIPFIDSATTSTHQILPRSCQDREKMVCISLLRMSLLSHCSRQDRRPRCTIVNASGELFRKLWSDFVVVKKQVDFHALVFVVVGCSNRTELLDILAQ